MTEEAGRPATGDIGPPSGSPPAERASADPVSTDAPPADPAPPDPTPREPARAGAAPAGSEATDQPAEEPTEQASEPAAAEAPTGSADEKPSADLPPTEQPADEPAPADQPTEEPADEPAQEPADAIQPAATNQPADKPAPADEPTEEPADEQARQPTDAEAQEPADAIQPAAADQPADKPAPADEPTEEPADEQARQPTDAEAQEPADAIQPAATDQPADKPAPAHEPTEEPADEQAGPPAGAAGQPAGASGRPSAHKAAAERGSGIGTPIPSAATTGGLNSGDIVTGIVSSVARKELELDLGPGRVGVIGSRHWAAGLDMDLTAEAKVGDTVEAAVLVREDHKQRIVLSRSWGRQQRAWETAENARKTGEIISGTVTDAVAAGLTVDIGVRAFVPASMAGDDDLESLVGKAVEFKVTEVNQLKGRCILSRKAALRTRERQSARKRLAELEPGTVLRARVTKVEDFGALVLAEGDLRGRIRRNELSWFRVRRPTEVVSVGDEVEARVLNTTPAKMSLDLSLRIGDDPLAAVAPGERHQATVTSLAPFGAFVTLDGGIRGLVPTAELSEQPIRHPREVVVPGDSVLAEITKVDRQRRELEFSVNLAMLVRPSESAG